MISIRSVFSFLTGCFLLFTSASAQQTYTATSINGQLKLTFIVSKDGTIGYAVTFKGKEVIKPSMGLGFKLKQPDITLNRFDVLVADSTYHDDTWEPVWGESKTIRNRYKELFVKMIGVKGQTFSLNITFRVFDEGIGFRYDFPTQPNLNHFVVAEELSSFVMAGNHKAFWIPGDYDTNEYGYSETTLADIDASAAQQVQEIYAKSTIGKNAVQTPLMMKSDDGIYLNIHEAALVNYPAMNLQLDKPSLTFSSHLVPDALGNKAYLQTPAKTPWRTLLISDKATDILNSRMILNLNEPSAIKDPSWIKPQKFVGVWWEMHVGTATWDLAGSQTASAGNRKRHHGANTANVKKYIDFAAANNIPSVLVEGWNVGWEDWFGQYKEEVFDFVTPYPDFNLIELTTYARAKGVKLIMHHETSASVTNYERQMDTAYRFMKKYGYDAVKTGYVGFIIPRGEHHDGQWMVKHYERVAKKTAEYQICVDMHEPVRPTGLHRTYPNWLACEAARGNEFNAWSKGNNPDHETILPFTRLIGGPMDYTPGIFQIKMNVYDSTKKEQVHTTLAKQLALYVTMYSPLQMAADLPENYEAHMDAFQFIKDVAVDWDASIALDAEPGDFIIEARKAKGSDDWFMGAITDDNPLHKTVSLNFLDADKKYVATIYRDAPNAHWKLNPMAYVIERVIVDAKTKLKFDLANGGGTAVSIMPVNATNAKGVKRYK
jgi:hypothetical protein